MSMELEVITPSRSAYSATVESVTLPTGDGEIQVLSGHRPLISTLMEGEVVLKTGEKTEYLAVGRGFVRVASDVVSLLTEGAAMEEEIDLAAVHEAKERARAALERAEAENLDAEEVEQLETVVRFSTLQELLKSKKRP